MSAVEGESQRELRARLSAIAMETQVSVGVDHFENLLVELLAFLKSGRIDRSSASAILIEPIDTWPSAPEVLEFTMRDLRWPEVRSALESHVAEGADFRTRRMAAQILEAYEDEWPGGEIYRSYRS